MSIATVDKVTGKGRIEIDEGRETPLIYPGFSATHLSPRNAEAVEAPYALPASGTLVISADPRP